MAFGTILAELFSPRTNEADPEFLRRQAVNRQLSQRVDEDQWFKAMVSKGEIPTGRPQGQAIPQKASPKQVPHAPLQGPLTAFEGLLGKSPHRESALGLERTLRDIGSQFPTVLPLNVLDLLALSFAESGFNPGARGQTSPDTGLFQISPTTNKDISTRLLGIDPNSVDLTDPETNALYFLLNAAAKKGVNQPFRITPEEYIFNIQAPADPRAQLFRYTQGGDIGSKIPGLFAGPAKDVRIPSEFVQFAKQRVKKK